MQKTSFTLGVDVSINTLDVYCLEVQKHERIFNNSSGFKAFSSFCRQNEIDLKDAIVVLEYTGGYEYKLLQYCQSKNISFVRIPGLAIKRSLGIVRGKNDKVDAARIAQYGDEKYKALSPEKPLNASISKLKELLGFRKKLIRENASYKATIKERKHMYEVGNDNFIIKSLSKKLKVNEKEIESTEQQIEAVVQADYEVYKNYLLIKSIRGIGKVNAWMTIAYTENFSSFKNARSYAVYVGVIPFDYQSGTSIRGKKRVSRIANKELKQELNQAARSAIQWDKEMREYATRKLRDKAYGIVLNNVKFKLILRMFAIVKRGENYVDNYTIAA
ncbi:MAG: transposase [Segetibacter sp.]|nr:transposase [Segetibacter sp.]